MEKMLKIDGNLAVRQGEREIITIEANGKTKAAVIRVAAYVRVSSSSEEQLNSYAAQNSYYTDLIAAHKDWKLVDIYADEGISGTSADKRDDFQRMMADCRRGLIDRVLVKSISRFARNTKDCLEAIRELKSIGVTVCFEKEKIDTAIMSSEMITAVMASLAQKESESIGSNMRWSYQKRMESGEFNTCKAPYGFRLVGNELAVEEPEAEVISAIFKMYLSGMNRAEIAKDLRQKNAPTRSDVSEWKESTVYYILSNERYSGNALLAKWITTESFPHKKVRNHGESPQYYVERSNPAIIAEETFKKAKSLAKRRTVNHVLTHTSGPFYRNIICGCCGATYIRRQPRSKEYWTCNSRYKNVSSCPMPSVSTEAIEDAFCRLYYKLKHHGEAILTKMISTHLEMKSRRMLWSLDVIELNKRIADLTNQNQLLTMLKQQGLVDSDLFISRSNTIAEQLRNAKLEKSRILEAEGDSTIQQTQALLDALSEGPELLETFDAELFDRMVEKIIVEDGEYIAFRMINGLMLREQIERMRR